MKRLKFILNGKGEETEVPEGIRLVDLLRDVYGLCGTKESCGQGECGACTVLVNKKAVHSCLLLATDEEIKEALEGNICRCTGYTKIIQAVRLAAEKGAGLC